MKNLLRRATSLTLASSVLLGIAACGDTGSSLNTSLTQDQAGAFAKKPARDGDLEWLVAVHLAADNNLYQFGLEDMNEMEAELKSDKVKFVVLFDGAKQGDSAVYEIQKDQGGLNKTLVSKKIENTGLIPSNNEIDSGDPKLAAKFANWVTDAYPAKHNAFVFWNHGGGVGTGGGTNGITTAKDYFDSKNSLISKPTRRLNEISTNDFCWDDNGTNMVTKDLNAILEPSAKKMGKKWDILNFDACLMAHTEVAYQVKNSVDFLVASEAVEPGKGNPYDFLGKAFSANPSMSGLEASKMYVRSYEQSYKGQKTTLSATDIASVASNLTPAINAFSEAMIANMDKDKVELKAIRAKSATFENNDCADLGHFASMASKSATLSPAVKEAAAKVVDELAKTVVANHSTANPNAQGLMMYFPKSGGVRINYQALEFPTTSKWVPFLRAFQK